MRWGLLSCALAVTLAAAAAAQEFRYMAKDTITVAGTAIGFTDALVNPSVGPQATLATCTLETGDVRYWVDGSTPTSSVGMYWTAATGPLSFGGNQILRQTKFIRVSGTSGVLNCSYTAP